MGQGSGLQSTCVPLPMGRAGAHARGSGGGNGLVPVQGTERMGGDRCLEQKRVCVSVQISLCPRVRFPCSAQCQMCFLSVSRKAPCPVWHRHHRAEHGALCVGHRMDLSAYRPCATKPRGRGERVGVARSTSALGRRNEEMSTWQVQLEQELGDGGQTAMQRVRMSPCACGVWGQ